MAADPSKVGKSNVRKGKTYERRVAGLLTEYTGQEFRRRRVEGRDLSVVERESTASSVISENYDIVKQGQPVGEFHLFSMAVQKFLTDNVTSIKYHIVYIDPPYDFPDQEIEKILINLLPHLDPIALVAVERDSKSKATLWPPGYVPQREKNYGTASIYYGGVAP